MAPIISGVALPVKDWAVVASFRISPTPITVPSAVFLVMAMARLVRGGTPSLIACGRTTWASVVEKVRPVERAASHWPLGVEVMPAQKISSAKAISTSASDSQVETKAEGDQPAEGRPK